MISKTFDNLFCILSNFVCLWPTWLFYKDNNKHDALFVFTTGMTSFAYHLNNNKPNLISFLNSNSISNADYMISDLCVMNIASYLAFYKDFNTRYHLLVVEIPLEIYSVSYGSLYRTYFMYSTVVMLFLRFLYTNIRKEKLKISNVFILLTALLINAIEIVCFEWLQNKNDESEYNFFHGIHHFCAFSSVALYYYVQKCFLFTDGRKIPRIISLQELHQIQQELDQNSFENTSDSYSTTLPSDEIPNSPFYKRPGLRNSLTALSVTESSVTASSLLTSPIRSEDAFED